MDTYEKKYKEALERAKKLHETCDSQAVVGWCEYIFPELAESEDEKIRKALITFFQRFPYDSIEKAGTNAKEAIAWLEKQGEQKQKQYDIDILEKHITKDYISELSHTVIVRNGWEIVEALRTEYEKGRADAFAQMQKEWSEEDEERIKNILSVLDVQVCWDGATGKKENPYQKEINWLKSLKERIGE